MATTETTDRTTAAALGVDFDGPVIDFGGHLYTDQVPFRPDHFDRYADIIPFFSDTDEMIRRYRAAGITGSVLVAPAYAQASSAERAATANDVLLDIIEAHGHYLGGLAAIPMLEDGAAAAAEFERCLAAGFNGGVMETESEAGLDLTAEAFEPIYEVADRTGAPILVHPKKANLLADTYRNDDIFGHEVALCDSLCTVVHDGLLDRYPGLTFIYDHYGGNVSSQLGRIRYRLYPDRWPGEVGDMKRWSAFRAQLEERIYLKMSGFYGHHVPLRAALEAFPTDHILFGTDFPFEVRTVDELARSVEEVAAHASRTDCRRMFGGNLPSVLYDFDLD